MNPDELPLLDLFNRLRQHGLLLGVEEYMAVLRALRAGFGVGDHRALEQLCCTVWVKSEEEARLFRRLFEQMLARSATQTGKPQSLLGVLIASLRKILIMLQNTFRRKVAKPRPGFATAPLQQVDETGSPPSSSLAMGTYEPTQVVQAVRRSVRDKLEMSGRHFSLLPQYFPVTRRQMKQSWRNLRRPVREGPPEELDVVATIEKIGREGILLEPVLVPRRLNRAELVLLIDQDGSMIPFHALARQLVETARSGGRLGRTGVFYFHDYPDDYLYRHPARLEAQPIPDVLAAIGEWTAVLILSDAGSARGHFDSERVARTRAFIDQLKQSVRHYAWLNPMPNDRWPGTTAGEIARLVPMFEMHRRGLDAAISALRGHYVYWERMYPWMM